MHALTGWGNRAAIALQTSLRMDVAVYPLSFFQSRNYIKKKLKVRRYKEPQVPLHLFKQDFSEPMSGSVIHPGIAEDRDREFSSDLESLKSKGFLRFQKPYTPPEDLQERFLGVVYSVLPNVSKEKPEGLFSHDISNAALKYELLTKMAAEFQHNVPSSMLPTMASLGNVYKFYKTEVNTNTPYENLIKQPDLPPNLHVQKDPVRFTSETSHYFGGLTAFPKQSTIVTGLRARKKYEGFKAKKSWP